jgi:hypothetical protein
MLPFGHLPTYSTEVITIFISPPYNCAQDEVQDVHKMRDFLLLFLAGNIINNYITIILKCFLKILLYI